ncbi:MAG: 30S ribosomal protein S8 [Planctomycetota bacterium]
MSMTDPIADMLTRIRNAARIRRQSVKMPRSNVKLGIAKVLADEGYIRGFEAVEDGVQGAIRIDLKYGPDDEDVIRKITRASKPGKRLFKGIDDVRPVLNGLGIAVLSTSKGIISDREARRLRVGGEVLCEVY